MTDEEGKNSLNLAEIHSLLEKYPTSLLPKTSFSLNSEAFLGNRILRKYDEKLPPNTYLSKSWLVGQLVHNKNLAPNDIQFILEALNCLEKPESQEAYQKVQKNPTVENILQQGVANCGELADSALPLFPKGTPVLRANIKVKIQTERFAEKGVLSNRSELPSEIELQHVFLIYTGKDDIMTPFLLKKNLNSPQAQGLDIWKRKTGNVCELCRIHLKELGIQSGILEVVNIETGQKSVLKVNRNGVVQSDNPLNHPNVFSKER